MLVFYLTAFSCLLLKLLDLEIEMLLDKVVNCCLSMAFSTEMLPSSSDFLHCFG